MTEVTLNFAYFLLGAVTMLGLVIHVNNKQK
jgi:hypothetical protein